MNPAARSPAVSPSRPSSRVASDVANPARVGEPVVDEAYASLQDLVGEIIVRWRALDAAASFAPTARDIVDRHPALEAHPSLVLDLAVEEYCLRRDRGAPLDPVAFAAQFPTSGQALAAMLLLFESSPEEIKELITRPAIAWPQSGQTFSGYLLLNELHRSEQSRVFLAAELALAQRLVVLKLVVPSTEEANHLGNLAHPNIVPVLTVQQGTLASQNSEDVHACTTIVMPFLGCATLADVYARAWRVPTLPRDSRHFCEAIEDGLLVKDHAASPVAKNAIQVADQFLLSVLKVAVDVCSALAFAHDKGILHRDLKPQNVLLTAEGRALLMDFGASAVLDSASPLPSGTLPYMAPECLNVIASFADATDRVPSALTGASRVSLDPRSDVFSVGVIVYQLLTGTFPFGVASSRATLREQATTLAARQYRNPLRRNVRNQHVPDDVFRLLDTCLMPTAEQRPISARALADSFRQIVAAIEGRDRRRRERRALLGIAAASVFAVSGAVAYGARRSVRSVNESIQEAVAAYENGDASGAMAGFQKIQAEYSADSGQLSVSQKAELAAASFGLGQCLVVLGSMDAASRSFEGSVKTLLRRRNVACLSYCLFKKGQRDNALALSDLACRDLTHVSLETVPEELRDEYCRLLSNHGCLLLSKRAYSLADVAFDRAESLLEGRSGLQALVGANRLTGWLRAYEEGGIPREKMLQRMRQRPVLGEDAPSTGLYYLTMAKAFAVAQDGRTGGVDPEVARYVLLAIAGGCSRQMIEESEVLKPVLALLSIPEKMFGDVMGPKPSDNDLFFRPTMSCRLE